MSIVYRRQKINAYRIQIQWIKFRNILKNITNQAKCFVLLYEEVFIPDLLLAIYALRQMVWK